MHDDDGLIRNHPSTKGKWKESDQEELSPGFVPENEGPPRELDWTAPVICINCVHAYDRRPWGKRLLFKLRTRDLFCSAHPRSPATNPVTGGITYIDSIFATPSKGLDEPDGRCRDINLYGCCPRYKEIKVEKANFSFFRGY